MSVIADNKQTITTNQSDAVICVYIHVHVHVYCTALQLEELLANVMKRGLISYQLSTDLRPINVNFTFMCLHVKMNIKVTVESLV